MRGRAILLLTTLVAAVIGGAVARRSVVTGCALRQRHPAGQQPDYIKGTSVAETIYAFGGDDAVLAYGGSDIIFGGAGSEIVDGGSGNDTIYGGPDADDQGLTGAADSDTVYGGQGSDIIDLQSNDFPSETATAPIDRSYGGRGNDDIDGVDGNQDIIDCGSGTADEVHYDQGIDKIKNCEKANPSLSTGNVRGGSFPSPYQERWKQ